MHRAVIEMELRLIQAKERIEELEKKQTIRIGKFKITKYDEQNLWIANGFDEGFTLDVNKYFEENY